MSMPHHKYRPYPGVELPDRTWPDRRITRRAALGLRRPARRQPGAHQPHGRRAQAAHVQAALRDRLQGDRGRLPVGLEGRLRLHARARRGGPDPRRRHDRRPHAGARPPDRAHVREPRGRAALDRAPLQLHLDDAAARRLPPRPRRASARSRCRARRWCASWPRRARGSATCATSTRPRASRPRSPTTRSRSARRSWTCSSRRRSGS